jgi:hypothetical protein
MRLFEDGWGFGGNAPNKLRPVLEARGVSMRATRAVGTAKSLFFMSQTQLAAVDERRRTWLDDVISLSFYVIRQE